MLPAAATRQDLLTGGTRGSCRGLDLPPAAFSCRPSHPGERLEVFTVAYSV